MLKINTLLAGKVCKVLLQLFPASFFFLFLLELFTDLLENLG